MRSAHLVGPSADGGSLVVVTEPDGSGGREELVLAVDDRLREAVGGDRPRTRQPHREAGGAVGPRDIQTRVRAGQSPAEVAEATGMELDRVERFASPVLAERAYVAALALSCSVRRRGDSAGHRTLRTVLGERLPAGQSDPEALRPDAYRREDGRWAVTTAYAAGAEEQRLEFWFDLPGRFSVAGNDAARQVLGEHAGRSAGGSDDGEPTVDLSDQLALVRVVQDEPAAQPPEDGTGDVDGAGPAAEEDQPGDAAPGPPPASGDEASDGSPPETSPLETLSAIFDAQTRPVPPELAASDAYAVPAPDAGPGALVPAPAADYPVEPSQVAEAPTDELPVDEAPVDEPPASEPPAAVSPQPTAPRPRASRRKRPSVPSWDEIMFGGPSDPA